MKNSQTRDSAQGSVRCANCGNAATCIGVYEDPTGEPEPACDECCAHGCEDGWCLPIEEYEAEFHETRGEVLERLTKGPRA